MKRKIFVAFALRISVISLLILFMLGCQVTRGLRAIMSKKVKSQHFTCKDKSVIFVPMVHFGRKEFYSSLKDSIAHWKNNGYTVFYEQVISGQDYLGLDSVAYDRLNRKFRRINRDGVGTAEDYEAEAQAVFKNGIAQPAYADLGIDSSDVLADVTFLDLVNKIEEICGVIELDSCDYATPLDSTYTCSKGLRMKVLDPIYVDYRNTVVVEKIINTETDKIVVLFGAIHIKGMKKLLKAKEKADRQEPKPA